MAPVKFLAQVLEPLQEESVDVAPNVGREEGSHFGSPGPRRHVAPISTAAAELWQLMYNPREVGASAQQELHRVDAPLRNSLEQASPPADHSVDVSAVIHQRSRQSGIKFFAAASIVEQRKPFIVGAKKSRRGPLFVYPVGVAATVEEEAE